MAAPESPRPTALVTGASGGIGLELAKLLAADGHDLILVARSGERLVALAHELADRHGVRAIARAADLADPAAPAALCAALADEGERVEVLVNNAGFGLLGEFARLEERAQMDMLQVNVAALTHLTRLLLPPMLARRRGGILNVASTAAFQPGPLMAVYYASKAYVLSFSEALAGELAGTGVTVTALCPGPTATGFQRRAAMEGARMLRDLRLMDAAAVARAGYRAFRAGRRVAVPGWTNRALAGAVRFVPRGLALRIARRLNSQAPE